MKSGHFNICLATGGIPKLSMHDCTGGPIPQRARFHFHFWCNMLNHGSNQCRSLQWSDQDFAKKLNWDQNALHWSCRSLDCLLHVVFLPFEQNVATVFLSCFTFWWLSWLKENVVRAVRKKIAWKQQFWWMKWNLKLHVVDHHHHWHALQSKWPQIEMCCKESDPSFEWRSGDKFCSKLFQKQPFGCLCSFWAWSSFIHCEDHPAKFIVSKAPMPNWAHQLDDVSDHIFDSIVAALWKWHGQTNHF